ncbi:MAG TPA: ABC transporter substrate-binding protein [Azonexus sp.]
MSSTSHRLLGALLIPLLLSASPAALADRLQAIASARLLRVCIWPDYHGISFRNPKTGELSGIDIDNARELGRELKVTVEFVDSSFATLADDLATDRCDIAMFAIGRTPARSEKLRFTAPYLASDIYAVTSRANRRIQAWADIDRPGTVVVVARGTLHETVMREELKAAELHIVDTPHAREQEVQAGRADVFMTDYPYTRRLLGSSDWARLVTPPAAFHVTPYAWAMAPGDDAFHARVEDFLARLKSDGRLRANARRHGLEPIVAR